MVIIYIYTYISTYYTLGIMIYFLEVINYPYGNYQPIRVYIHPEVGRIWNVQLMFPYFCDDCLTFLGSIYCRMNIHSVYFIYKCILRYV